MNDATDSESPSMLDPRAIRILADSLVIMGHQIRALAGMVELADTDYPMFAEMRVKAGTASSREKRQWGAFKEKRDPLLLAAEEQARQLAEHHVATVRWLELACDEIRKENEEK